MPLYLLNTPPVLTVYGDYRVFGIDITTYPACGGAIRIIACIEHPEVIIEIVRHLDTEASESPGTRLPPSRAPPQPQPGLFD